MQIILTLLFGAFVGWIAGIIMKDRRSFIRNIILGIVGSLVGGFIASFLGFGELGGTFRFDLMNTLISVGGACVVIFLVGILRRK